MKPIHLVAAALFAAGGLVLSTPAEAAPKGGPSVSAPAGDLLLIDHRDRDDRRAWRRHRDRDDDDGRRGRRHWDDDDDDRDEWRHRQRRGDRWGEWRGDRGRHFGWERGRHRGWHRGRGHAQHGDRWDWRRGDRDWRHWRGDRRDDHWSKKERKKWAKKRRERRKEWAEERRERWEDWREDHRRWRARQHPRREHWIGRPFWPGNFSRLNDYGDYRLPAPWGNQFYARNGNDVFLVDEATRRIMNAFVLYDVLGR